MKHRLSILPVAAAVAAVALILTATAVGVVKPPPVSASSTARVEIVRTSLGKVLADSRGHTLYLFAKDSRSKSACSGACAQAWPPLTTTAKPTASPGVASSKLGTINRGKGVKQVTYNGHPLYGFVKDTGPRQTHGQGLTAFGAKWFALTPSGKAAASSGSSNGL